MAGRKSRIGYGLCLLVAAALLFVAVMRRYLLNMWGTTLR